MLGNVSNQWPMLHYMNCFHICMDYQCCHMKATKQQSAWTWNIVLAKQVHAREIVCLVKLLMLKCSYCAYSTKLDLLPQNQLTKNEQNKGTTNNFTNICNYQYENKGNERIHEYIITQKQLLIWMKMPIYAKINTNRNDTIATHTISHSCSRQ